MAGDKGSTEGPPPTNADGARAAARERDEAITRFLGLAGELVAPLASLVLSRTAREPTALVGRASEGEWTHRVAEAAKVAGRDEIRDTLDEEIRSLRYELPSCDSDEEAQSLRLRIDALQTFRYRVCGQPLDLEDED